MKKCTSCGIEKESKDFYLTKRYKKNSLYSECKDCYKNRKKKYRQSEKGKITCSNYEKKYRKTTKGRAVKKFADSKYRKTEKGKALHNANSSKFQKTEKGKLIQSNYWKSKKGKILAAKHSAKRKRELDFVLINSWFPGCNMHHLNEIYVLAIPASLHKQYYHSHKDLNSMQEINYASIKWFYSLT